MFNSCHNPGSTPVVIYCPCLLWLVIFSGHFFKIIIIVLTAEKRNNKIKSDKKLTEIGDNFSSRNIKCRSPAERISLHEHGLLVFVGIFFIFL